MENVYFENYFSNFIKFSIFSLCSFFQFLYNFVYKNALFDNIKFYLKTILYFHFIFTSKKFDRLYFNDEK